MGEARSIAEIVLRRPETLVTLAVASAGLVPVAATAMVSSSERPPAGVGGVVS